MRFFDLHSDLLTEKLHPKSVLNKTENGVEIALAIFRRNYDFKYVFENFLKPNLDLISNKFHLAFEDVCYPDFDVDLISKFNPLYASLTYNSENDFGFGAYSSGHLKSKGYTALKKLYLKKIAIDISHSSYQTALDIISTGVKVLNSHTAYAKIFTHPRNIDYTTAKAIVECGGIVGFTPVSYFLGKNATINTFTEHIDAFCQDFGCMNLSIATDFFGSDSYAKGIYSYKDFFKVKKILSLKGYTKENLDNIFYKNATRFFFS